MCLEKLGDHIFVRLVDTQVYIFFLCSISVIDFAIWSCQIRLQSLFIVQYMIFLLFFHTVLYPCIIQLLPRRLAKKESIIRKHPTRSVVYSRTLKSDKLIEGNVVIASKWQAQWSLIEVMFLQWCCPIILLEVELNVGCLRKPIATTKSQKMLCEQLLRLCCLRLQSTVSCRMPFHVVKNRNNLLGSSCINIKQPTHKKKLYRGRPDLSTP